MTVLIDVDLTLVDTLSPWLRWFKARTGVELSADTYNIENQMREYMLHEDPLSYWKGADVYKNLPPYNKSVDTVRKLIDEGFEVVFVTWSPFFEQISTKEAWLTEHFGGDIPVIHTDHKELVDGDILIDDNPEMLTKFLDRKSGRVGLKYDTQLNKDWRASYGKKSLTMRGWTSVQEYFHTKYGVTF